MGNFPNGFPGKDPKIMPDSGPVINTAGNLQMASSYFVHVTAVNDQ
jgi:hypothetical protein